MNGAEKADYSKIFYQFSEINFALIAFLVAAAFLLVVFIQRALPWIARHVPGRFRLYILPAVPILRLFILAALVFSIIPLIIKPTARNFLALFGAAGLAIGFAFKDYVSGLIAGVVALYEHPYRPGDWVKINDIYGEVESMGLRSLRLVTPDDTIVTVPHSKIWDSLIQNANDGKRDHQCIAEFYLHPAHDAALARRKLIDVALTSPYLQLKRAVAVVVAEKPWGTQYRLKAYPIDGRDEFQFTSDLTVRGKAALAEIGARPAAAVAAVNEAR